MVSERSGCQVAHVGYANAGDARSCSVQFSDDGTIPPSVDRWSLTTSIDEMLNGESGGDMTYYDSNEVSIRRLFGVVGPSL
jgi:hypothetical protein